MYMYTIILCIINANMFSEPPLEPLPNKVGGVTNTNDHLLRTHQYNSSHARTYIIAYTELLKNCPFAIPLTLTTYLIPSPWAIIVLI